MQPPPQPGRRSRPALFQDLLHEILLRVPPDEPARLARLSLVCKPWRQLLSDSYFLRRYREFHRTPPMLGFFLRLQGESDHWWVAPFFPTSAFRPPRRNHLDWCPLDCRHGRVLFDTLLSLKKPMDLLFWDLLVWDPIADGLRGLPFPNFPHLGMNAAVLCAVNGCDHLDCHGGPFLVAYVGTDDEGLTSACVYSSVTGAWSEPISVEHPVAIVEMCPSVLLGNTVYFPCEPTTRILEYDMGKQELTVIDGPFPFQDPAVCTILMTAEDGGLGIASVQEFRLYLWSRVTGPNGTLAWAPHRVIQLEPLLPARETTAHVIGFADGVGLIFVRTGAEVFTIELKSGHARKMSEWERVHGVIPYMSFYTPVKGVPESGYRGRVRGLQHERIAN